MTRIIIRGYAAVFQGEIQIDDQAILRSLDGLIYGDERFTDYICGPGEDEIAEVLEPGGIISFAFKDNCDLLTAVTEYRSFRPLNENELKFLVDYTMGQWSDGVGENWTGISPDRCGYTIMCLTPGDGVNLPYPEVEVVGK